MSSRIKTLRKPSGRLPSLSSAKTKPKSELLFNVAAMHGAHSFKGKCVNLKVSLACTDEVFNVVGVPLSMKVRDLKASLEFICGIPFELQRLSYLDDGELVDSKELLYYDLIEGGIIDMNVWTPYVGLVKTCALTGNIEDALKQGVSLKVEWHAPTSDYMFKNDRIKYITNRSGIALFIASHRGNIQLVKDLISYGAHVNYTSSFGRTPIMVAVIANKTDVIDYLLEKNVNIDIKDLNGDTALTIAKKFKNKLGQYRLTQYKWKKRTEAEHKSQTMDENDVHQLMPAHASYDSSKKTWLKGEMMQIYMMQVRRPSEYSGGALWAPKSVGRRLLKERREMQRSLSELRANAIANGGDGGDGGGGESSASLGNLSSTLANSSHYSQNLITFDAWLKKKIKSKQIEMKRNKKLEMQTSQDDSAKNESDSPVENAIKIHPDDKKWMKDYIKESRAARENSIDPNLLFGPTNQARKESLNNNSEDMPNGEDFYSSSTSSFFKSNSSRKHFELLDVYKGMSYDEWTEIRDKFLRTHPIK